jgi:type II secretory pathway component PulK
MKSRSERKRPGDRGFALVVTLSLMILLTIIAVGLLSLSSVSLRSSSQESAQAEAQGGRQPLEQQRRNTLPDRQGHGRWHGEDAHTLTKQNLML